MEREPQPASPKLIDVARQEYPTASEILVSFPDQWEFLDVVRAEKTPIYIAGFPIARERPKRHHFEGLPPEINVSLVFYRLYKFFRPWPMPTLVVDWDRRAGQGRVISSAGGNVHLQSIGQAQAWFGINHAVLWECYLHEIDRRANRQATLAGIWQRVESDLRVNKVCTLPHEPAFAKGYTDFLARLGYAVDLANPDWWSKELTR